MKKHIVILGILLFCLVLAVSGCRYPIRAADFTSDKAEEIVFLGEGEDLSPLDETEAQRRARWERIKGIAFKQIMEDWDNFWLLDKPSKLSDKYIR
ncbi:MAG: hypothetical protein DRP65_08690 [Planctomycetota bacterium]|nr:MAG: hypothetical protein DRP65_08690 [Planctomycetota bacterium]